jgi:hypothetical protein
MNNNRKHKGNQKQKLIVAERKKTIITSNAFQKYYTVKKQFNYLCSRATSVDAIIINTVDVIIVYTAIFAVIACA